jgi:cytochrome P450
MSSGESALPRYRMSLDNPTHVQFHSELEESRTKGWLHTWLCGYLVFNHDDVTTLLRDRRLHQGAGKVPAMMAGVVDPVSSLPADDILLAEGEKHTRLRRLVAEAFSPRAIESMRPGIRAHADTLVERAMATSPRDEHGRTVVDFTAMVSELPIAVIGQLLGTGPEDFPLHDKWAESHFQVLKSSAVDDTERDARLARAAEEFDAYCTSVIDQRRRSPGSDLLSRLIAVEEAGDRLSTSELVSLVRSIIAAGIDTTRNQIGSMMALVVDNPTTWFALRDQPDLVVGAVEESLRLLNPIRTAMRIVNETFEYRGVTFDKGTLVALSLSGASRDPGTFSDSATFDPTRSNARDHLAFSFGVHHCLGAALARVELQEMLRSILDKWTSVDVIEPITWKHAKLPIWGPDRIVLAVTGR